MWGPKVKKWVGWFLLAFCVYAVFKSPEQAANLVRGAVDGIFAVFDGIGKFFDALLRG